jgi:AcrR family transcriptional regulator
LRVRDTDAEFEKSQQLIHHYFSGKDELVTEMLSYLVESIDDELDSTTDDDPATKLSEEIDRSLLGSTQDNGEHLVVMTAL